MLELVEGAVYTASVKIQHSSVKLTLHDKSLSSHNVLFVTECV